MSAQPTRMSLLDVVICGGGALMLILVPLLVASGDPFTQRYPMCITARVRSSNSRVHWELVPSNWNGKVIAVPGSGEIVGSRKMTFCIPELIEAGKFRLRLFRQATGERDQLIDSCRRTTLKSWSQPDLAVQYRSIYKRYLLLKEGKTANDVQQFEQMVNTWFKAYQLEYESRRGTDPPSWPSHFNSLLEYRLLSFCRDLNNGSATVPWSPHLSLNDRVQELSSQGEGIPAEAVHRMIQWETELFKFQHNQLPMHGPGSESVTIPEGLDSDSSRQYWAICTSLFQFRAVVEARPNLQSKFNLGVTQAEIDRALDTSILESTLALVCLELGELFPKDELVEIVSYWGGHGATSSTIPITVDSKKSAFTEVADIVIEDLQTPPKITKALP